MTQEEQDLKLVELEQRSKSNIRRIEKLELQTEAIQRLALSVEILVKEQSHQTEAIDRVEKNVDKLDKKVATLEAKPGKRWDSIVEKILLATITALVCYILARLGIG